MFKDLTELRKLILENEDCKLVIFCGEDSWSGEFAYEYGQNVTFRLAEVAEFKSEFTEPKLLYKDDYEEELQEKMVNDTRYADLTDEEFFKELEHEMSKVNFEKVIAITVG